MARRWRRIRRRSAQELSAAFGALRSEPHALRTAYGLVRTALQFRIYPHDALLYELDRRPAAEGRDYLTKRSHMLLQDQLNPARHHHRVLNKLDYHVTCAARGVPAPSVLAVVDFGPDDGRCAKLKAVRIETVADMAAFLGSLPKPSRIIFKALAGTYAHGLLGLTVGADGAVDHEGRRFDPAAILEHCQARRKDGGFLVQPWLEPDPTLLPLMPGPALGTIRVVSLLVADQVQISFAFLKIPATALIYDAFNHGRSGNLLALVNVAKGTLEAARGPSRSGRLRLDTYLEHPRTGAAIEGFRVPQWREVLRTVAAGARAFPELKTLGWDVAVSSQGVFLLEANHHWDPEPPQLLMRRGFLPDMEELVQRAQNGQEAIASSPAA